jgi:hypothetical protein
MITVFKFLNEWLDFIMILQSYFQHFFFLQELQIYVIFIFLLVLFFV